MRCACACGSETSPHVGRNRLWLTPGAAPQVGLSMLDALKALHDHGCVVFGLRGPRSTGSPLCSGAQHIVWRMP